MPRKTTRDIASPRLTGEALLSALDANRGLDRLPLAARCGYAGKRGALAAFYQAITEACGLATRSHLASTYRQFLLKKEGGSTPLVERGRIVGRRELRISPRACEQDWTAETWRVRERQQPFDNLDAPFEVLTSYTGHATSSLHYGFDAAGKTSRCRRQHGRLAFQESRRLGYRSPEALPGCPRHPGIVISETERQSVSKYVGIKRHQHAQAQS